ncbi:hypothetical protein CFC21_107877 [Triticum aestivum]|uniref:histidine kinase n=2 Tax=Triticum aestivum TaxID=4565 RepID=A0A9R1NB45_WHEAT|nr:hypothetical protein CFC21_107877 [Triticum aestivum]
MEVSLTHVAAGMQSLIEANHSAAVVAHSLQIPGNKSSHFRHVGPYMFMALAMQQQVAEMSYTSVNGTTLTYYRAEKGQQSAKLVSQRGKWYTEHAVDPVTGRLTGRPVPATRPEHLPNATQLLAAASSGSPVALWAGWVHSSVQVMVFSAPVGQTAVVSAAIPVDVLTITSLGTAADPSVDTYYAITDKRSGAATVYKPLVGGRPGHDAELMKTLFSDTNCTASAIDKPNIVLHSVGSDQVACTSFDLSGVNLGVWLVLSKWSGATKVRQIGVAVVCIVCAITIVATVVCFLMAQVLWRVRAREVALEADLVQQKEALQQTEHKSVNKSNAFARDSHDIRSSLAAVAGLIEISRPETRGNTNLIYNLNQMDVGTNKLFDILNTILDMGKLESGKIQIEEVEFRMANVLEESMDLANVIGMSRGVEVIWDPCDFSVLRCTATIGDCKRVKQILDNLLGNAIKFTHEGHVMLRAWANHPTIRGSMISTPSRFGPRRRTGGVFRRMLGRSENCAEQTDGLSLKIDPDSVEFYFEVVDTGVGIPEEKRESIFENYVRLMGGEINIKDKEPGEAGTCFGFNVFLKASESPEIEDNLEEGRAAPSLFREPACFKGGHCILLVHGDETRRILHTWMESIGTRVWPVSCAELLAPTIDKVCSTFGASPSRSASMSLLHSAGGGATDRCFSSKEIVSDLRNSSGMAGNHAGHLHALGLLVVIDVSAGRLHEVAREAASLARTKLQAPCGVVCLTDLKTPSQDLRRFMEASSCDLELHKPIHGSRLHKLLQVMRDLQASHFEHLHLYQFEMPAADQTTASASEITPAVPMGPANVGDGKPLEGMRVLLVDDTMLLQKIHEPMLSDLGAAVVIAGDGSVAVAMFTEALHNALPYDVVLMDCQMLVMNGYEATRRIREEESRYGVRTPIIALTANSAKERLREAVEAGMDLHLTKPIPKPKIAGVVLELCKQDKN